MLRIILRRPDVLHARGRSRSSHYSDIRKGLFTRPVRLGPRCVGWPFDEVAALNEARISGKSDDEIRALVVGLEEARKIDWSRDEPAEQRIQRLARAVDIDSQLAVEGS